MKVTFKQLQPKGKNVSEKTNVNVGGAGLGGLLFILFLGLKLTHYIDWSWWWITAPLWIPMTIVIAIICFVLTFAALVAVCKS